GIVMYQDVSGWSFAGQNLTGASFQYDYGNTSGLIGTDFTGAIVKNANFSYSHITAAPLYLTASYQNKNLTGMDLIGVDLTGFNFSGQNLFAARFGSYFGPTDFSQTNLQNAYFDGYWPSSQSLVGADLRGATTRYDFGFNNGGPHSTFIDPQG